MAANRRSTGWIAEEFDRRAATYGDSQMHRWQARHAAQLLNPKPGQCVLDLATGTGLAAHETVQIGGPTTTVVGVDISEGMLRCAVAASDPRRCHYVRADAHRLPFQQAVFDAIVCVAAISYFDDLPRVIAEWRRVGRPAATVVFTTPAADGLPVIQLIRSAAAAHNIAIPDPNADIGTAGGIAKISDELQLAIDDVVTNSFPEALQATPKQAFDTILNYGFAGHLEDLAERIQAQVFATFEQAYLKAQRKRESSQDWLFARCYLPTGGSR